MSELTQERIYHSLAAALGNGMRAAVATVIKTAGATPRRAGAKILLFEDGSVEGTLGGGRFEAKVVEDASRALETRSARVVEYNLDQLDGMACGGRMEVFIDIWSS